MRISLNTSLSFKRRLKDSEKAGFSDTLTRGKSACGNTGHSVLIMPSVSLPQSLSKNTGTGNMLAKDAAGFFDFAKQYWGINYVQLLAEGQYKNCGEEGFKPYSGSSLDLGTHLINTELLTEKEFANLLSKEDFEEIIKANTHSSKDTTVNFENVLNADSKTEEKLRKAYNELMKSDTAEKQKMIEEMKAFETKNAGWLESKSIYAALTKEHGTADNYHWPEIDKNLNNPDVVSLEKKNERIKEILAKNGEESGFYKFKQYLADKHFKLSKDGLNEKGIKLSGDFLYGYSPDEIWANPKAFHKDLSSGFGIRAMNFETPEAEKLLREKANLFAQRYDGIRIDMAWAYANQPIYKNEKEAPLKRYGYDNKFLGIIEDEFKKVKGEKFKSDDIMYEFISKLEDFNIYEGENIKPFVENKVKIYCSNGMHENWGSTDNFKKRGWNDGAYLLGTTNHDCKPMKIQYAEEAERKIQTSVLADILKIPKEKLSNLNDFIKAKFAEPMRAKHNMIFYLDALSLDGQYQHNKNIADDYRIKIPESYQEKYFNGLEKGEGFNVMDALEKAFVSKGLDKKEPDLYKNIVKYRKILEAPEGGNKKTKIALICGGVVLALAAVALLIRRGGSSASAHQDN